MAFALGVWSFQQLPELPGRNGLHLCMLLMTLAGLGWFLLRGGTAARAAVLLGCVAAALAGWSWAGWRAEWRLNDALPMQYEGVDILLTGVVAELPQPLGNGVRFVLAVEQAAHPVPRRVQLSWYGGRGEEAAPRVAPGERWRFTVRLKRPHGFSNPHGFDYEAWLLERGIRATGYVRAGGQQRLAGQVACPMLWVQRQRERIRARFAATLGEAPQAGIVTALAIGDQRAIAAEQWQVFRRTGVNHLVAISGLHVSLVAVFAGLLAGLLWRRVPGLLLRVPLRRAAALAGLLGATAYALLAGLGIPVQRALIMLAVVALAMVSGREAAGSRVLALALLAVLLVDPWAVLAAGFWLSFAAVAVILLVLGGRIAPQGGWRAALCVQLAITLALVPALLVLFQAFSLVSPLANALAIPLVSFVIAPLALAAAVLPIDALLHLADWCAGWMMRWLGWLAASPLAVWQQAAPPGALVLAGGAGVLWLLLPRGTPGRLAGVLAVLPLLLWTPVRPPAGGFVATVLDVGQGQAIHVQTARHDLLIDAGPPYGPTTDAGARVVLPYLNAQGVRRLDALMVTHGDADHAGGAQSVLDGVEVGVVYASLAPGHALRERTGDALRPCVAGDAWAWDGVRFAVLHPDGGRRLRKENDNACVLRVATAEGALLVTSDIEALAERELLARGAAALAGSVVVAPHHGSRSSSTAALVDAVRPAAVIYSVGYRNPFRHPHPEVWARWSAGGARAWRTDSQGAIRIALDGGGLRIAAQRELRPRYWHGR